MNFQRQKLLLPFLLTVFVLGFAYLVTSSAFAWETQDQQLAEDWAKMVGFKSKERVGKVAPEIKPGTVIDANNYKDFPGLKELLSEAQYIRLDPSAYAPLAPIKIDETSQYHFTRGCLEASLKSVESCHLDQDGVTVLGYQGGVPFIHPKNGNELIQWVNFFYAGDSLAFRPMRLMLYGRNNKPEREMRQEVNNLLYYGCTDWREQPPNPDRLHHVASGVFTYPRDLSGTAYTRKRYIDGDKADEFLIFIASMRRIRRMSGRDTQDTLFGSDLVWDDYKMFWQKLSATEFPNEFKMLPEQEMLTPNWVYYKYPQNRVAAGVENTVDESGDQVYLRFDGWQRRIALPVEIISKDSNYVYGRRVLYNDAETGGQLVADYYDQAGRLWRNFIMNNNLSPKGEGMTWDFADIVDLINNHRTILDFNGIWNPTWVGDDYADLRFLSRKAK